MKRRRPREKVNDALRDALRCDAWVFSLTVDAFSVQVAVRRCCVACCCGKIIPAYANFALSLSANRKYSAGWAHRSPVPNDGGDVKVHCESSRTRRIVGRQSIGALFSSRVIAIPTRNQNRKIEAAFRAEFGRVQSDVGGPTRCGLPLIGRDRSGKKEP